MTVEPFLNVQVSFSDPYALKETCGSEKLE